MSIKYMLDTNICIYMMNKRSSNVIEQIKRHMNDGLCISSITLSELEYGAAKSASYERNIVAIQKILSLFSVLPYDEAAASCYGNIRTQLERKGQTIGPLDMLIGAHAKSRELILVTNNVREFKRIEELVVVDWSAPLL